MSILSTLSAPKQRIAGNDPLDQDASPHLQGMLNKNNGTGGVLAAATRMATSGRTGGTPAGRAPKVKVPVARRGPAPKPGRPPVTPGTYITGGVPKPVGSPSDYGLNLNDSTPFNPYNMPKTTGAFNTMVLNAAKSQYQPLLDQVAADKSAEQNVHGQRTTDLGGIYNDYAAQTAKAFKDAQDALGAIIAGQRGTDDAQSQALKAALASNSQGSDQLRGMLGLSASTDPNVAASDSALMGQTKANEGDLSKVVAGLLNQSSQAEGNVGTERAQQLNQEGIRDVNALGGIQSQSDQIQAQIPSYVETARQKLLTDIENAQSLKFQQGLANKQFGLSAQAQKFNQGLATKQFNLAASAQAEKAANDAAQLGLNKDQLDIQRQQILASVQNANTKAGTDNAKNLAKALDNGSVIIDNFLKPTAQELTKQKVTNPDGSTTTSDQVNTNLYHRKPEDLYRQLTIRAGLSQRDALKLMTAVDTAGPGGQAISAWAQSQLDSLGIQGHPGRPLAPLPKSISKLIKH